MQGANMCCSTCYMLGTKRNVLLTRCGISLEGSTRLRSVHGHTCAELSCIGSTGLTWLKPVRLPRLRPVQGASLGIHQSGGLAVLQDPTCGQLGNDAPNAPHVCWEAPAQS